MKITASCSPTARGAHHRVLQAVVEQQAVRQAGERIVVGQVVELFLRFLQLGDVAEHAHVMADGVVVVAHRGHRQPLEVDLAVLAGAPDLAAPEAGLRQVAPQAVVEFRFVAGAAGQAGAGQARLLADRLALGIAGDLGVGRVGGDDPAVHVDHHHAVGDVLQHRGGQAQLFLGLAALGDVGVHPDAVALRALGVDRAAAHLAHEQAAVAAAVQVFVAELLAAGQDRRAGGDAALVGLVIREQHRDRLADQRPFRIAEQLVEAAVGRDHPQVALLDDAEHHVVEHRALLGQQGLDAHLVVLALADVGDDPVDPECGVAALRHRLAALQHPALDAVRHRRSGIRSRRGARPAPLPWPGGAACGGLRER
jgi:hypothetical protein